MLEKQRPEKCTLKIKDFYNTRVHRRLCDFSILAPFAEQCNCSLSLLDKTLYKVTGVAKGKILKCTETNIVFIRFSYVLSFAGIQ